MKRGDGKAADAQRPQEADNRMANASVAGIAKYCQLLKAHDWLHAFSEDQAVWRKGVKEREELLMMQPEVDPGFELWNRYAPMDMRIVFNWQSREA